MADYRVMAGSLQLPLFTRLAINENRISTTIKFKEINMVRTFTSAEEIILAIGEPLGNSEWLTIDQARIDAFAEATGDDQWIHVDAERAASGPFGKTIAHGYLTLSMVVLLGREVFEFDTGRPMINYGINKVRFPSPVGVNSRIRAVVSIVGAQPVSVGTQVTMSFVIEIESEAKPACVAETVILML
jgi:acyl dehydratase